MASIVSGMAAIWSLTAITLERALVIRRLGYRGARKQTIRRVTQPPLPSLVPGLNLDTLTQCDADTMRRSLIDVLEVSDLVDW